MARTEYVFEDMTLGELLVVLCDHGLTFDILRSMTTAAIYDYLKRVNAGEVKSWKEKEAERVAKLAAKR